MQRRHLGGLATLCAVAAIATISLPRVSAGAPPVDQPTADGSLFTERFDSYRAGSYDPLTVPPDWFFPTEAIVGASRHPTPKPLAPTPNTRISSTALRAASAYAAQQDSAALLIYHDGALAFEKYWGGTGRESAFNPQSMSKSLLGMMIGIGIKDGHIESVDDRVDRYVDEWRDDERGAITIGQLLQMSGGLGQISTSYDVTIDNPGVKQHFGDDFVAPILELPLTHQPGTHWEYNNNESNLLGVILERASGRRYSEYLSASLWRPLGLSDAALYMDSENGSPMFSCCVLSRPLDWLKLGVLFLDGGVWEGRQLVPRPWIDAMATPAATNSGYGYQVWLGDYAVAATRPQPTYDNQPYASEPFADPKTVVFRGFGYQRVWIMPSKKLVIVRAGRTWPSDWDNAAIPNTIYRGIDDAPGSVGE